MQTHDELQKRYQSLSPFLNERMRRIWAAAEAVALGHGGVLIVSKATKISRRAIAEGKKELDQPPLVSAQEPERIRRAGGGRKPISKKLPGVEATLEKLVISFPRRPLDGETCEDKALAEELEKKLFDLGIEKQRLPFLWTCKGVQALADELCACGFQLSHTSVADLLNEMGYSLQANRKSMKGSRWSMRDIQFMLVCIRALRFQAESQPVISVDFKKSELVGRRNKNGENICSVGEPACTNDGHSLVNVETDDDTVAFVVESIRRWWLGMGKKRYPDARTILVTAADGDFGDSRGKTFQELLQKLADEIGLELVVSLLPPGTTKWHRIEHSQSSQTTMHWHGGKPGVIYEVLVSLIALTHKMSGIREDDEMGMEMEYLQLEDMILNTEESCGLSAWNFTVRPHSKQ